VAVGLGWMRSRAVRVALEVAEEVAGDAAVATVAVADTVDVARVEAAAVTSVAPAAAVSGARRSLAMLSLPATATRKLGAPARCRPSEVVDVDGVAAAAPAVAAGADACGGAERAVHAEGGSPFAAARIIPREITKT
jgi:hypothetical protein